MVSHSGYISPLAMQEVAVEVTHDREDAEEPEEDEGA